MSDHLQPTKDITMYCSRMAKPAEVIGNGYAENSILST